MEKLKVRISKGVGLLDEIPLHERQKVIFKQELDEFNAVIGPIPCKRGLAYHQEQMLKNKLKTLTKATGHIEGAWTTRIRELKQRYAEETHNAFYKQKLWSPRKSPTIVRTEDVQQPAKYPTQSVMSSRHPSSSCMGRPSEITIVYWYPSSIRIDSQFWDPERCDPYSKSWDLPHRMCFFTRQAVPPHRAAYNPRMRPTERRSVTLPSISLPSGPPPLPQAQTSQPVIKKKLQYID